MRNISIYVSLCLVYLHRHTFLSSPLEDYINERMNQTYQEAIGDSSMKKNEYDGNIIFSNGLDKEVSKDLFDVIGNVNRYDQNGKTPLLLAIFKHQLEQIEKLLQAGANPNQGSKVSSTKIDSNQSQYKVDDKSVIFPEDEDQDEDEENIDELPIFVVVKYGYYEAADLLIRYRVNVNVRNSAHMTPLHMGLTLRLEDLAIRLIRGGADPNAIIENEITPLIIASQYGMLRAVNALLDSGAEVNHVSSSMDSPLMYACSGGRPDVIQALLSRNANILVRNKLFGTPLMMAVSRNKVQAVIVILNALEERNLIDLVNDKDKSNRSALDIAVSRGYQKIVDELVAFGADMGKQNIHVDVIVRNRRQQTIQNRNKKINLKK